MDPAELPGLQQDERDLMMATAANLSPRRRIETSRQVMPGGLIVTTQTTTMERPNDGTAPVTDGTYRLTPIKFLSATRARTKRRSKMAPGPRNLFFPRLVRFDS